VSIDEIRTKQSAKKVPHMDNHLYF